jgi:geranylgeranyl diphosphate synthase type I
MHTTRTIRNEIRARAVLVREYVFASRCMHLLPEGHLRRAVLSYPESGGKAIRAGLAMLSCGAVGSSEDPAVPVAAAVEMFHSFSLVHDDIIDNDPLRRGRPTVHKEFAQIASSELGADPQAAHHYGTSLGILAGDSQHGWAVSLLCEGAESGRISYELAVKLIDELEAGVLNTLVQGELLDVQYTLDAQPQAGERGILEMLDKKTGALYEFSCKAGALAGIGEYRPQEPRVEALSRFGRAFGRAFQIRDDILGIVGTQEELGKPIGSDLREGKSTLVLSHAFAHADEDKKGVLRRSVGNREMSDEAVAKTRDLLVSLGSIDYAQSQVSRYAGDAEAELEPLPDSEYKRLLIALAEASMDRTR